MDATKESLYEGIKAARAGGRIGDISNAVQSYVEARGFSVVRQFVGHGIGTNLHEEPEVPNFGKLIKLEDKIVSLFRSRRAGRHALVISSEENYSECA